MEATPSGVLHALGLTLLALAGCTAELDFRDDTFLGFEAADLGIDSRYTRGVCVVDVDGDLDPDVVLTRALGVHLWINDGDGRFDEQGSFRGMPGPAEWLGCGAADVDEDGDEDLLLTDHEGPSLLLLNDGAGVFVDATTAAGLGGSVSQGSVVWTDLDQDGHQDLLLTGVYRGNTRLYRGRGDGTFIDETAAAGLTDVERSWSAGSFDADNDGLPDLFLTTDVAQPASDDTDDRLLLGAGDFTFTDATRDAEISDASDGMGLAVADVDQNSFLDLFVTNIGPHFLWRNLGGLFLNASTAARIENDGGRVGWGTFFVDVDEDADLDLFVANGGYYERGEVEPLHEGLAPRNRLFLQSGIESEFPFFSDGGAEVQIDDEGRSSMGAAWADLDGDGRIDILVANLEDEPVTVRRSLGHLPGYDPGALRVMLRGTASNREALGARVVAETCVRFTLHTVGTGPSVFSQGERVVHVPLDGCGAARLHVAWPSGLEELFVVDDPERDVVRELVEGQGD